MDRISRILAFLAENPNDEFLQYALAQEYIGQGNDALAENQFKTLLDKSPEYIATYYHYAKLLERKNCREEALEMYRNGIEMAKKLGEKHALSELQSAMLELEYE